MKTENINSVVLSPRPLATGSPAGDALENVITTTIADGALCYVRAGAGQGLWELEKGSAAVPDGTTIVSPISGPGRWLKKLAPGPLFTPTLAQVLAVGNDASNQAIVGLSAVSFQLLDLGNSGAAINVDASLASKIRVTLTANAAITIVGPAQATNFILELVQGGIGNFLPTWSANTRARAALDIALAAGATTEVPAFWNGTFCVLSSIPALISPATSNGV